MKNKNKSVDPIPKLIYLMVARQHNVVSRQTLSKILIDVPCLPKYFKPFNIKGWFVAFSTDINESINNNIPGKYFN